MALIIPIIAGVSGLITGISSGYYFFHKEEGEETIKDTGIINNTVEINETSETVWIMRILLTIIILVLLGLGAYKAIRKIMGNNKKPNTPTSAIPAV